MRIYVLLKENEVIDPCYTSLVALCDDYLLPYSSISRGNHIVLVAGVKYEIKRLTIKQVRRIRKPKYNY